MIRDLQNLGGRHGVVLFVGSIWWCFDIYIPIESMATTWTFEFWFLGIVDVNGHRGKYMCIGPNGIKLETSSGGALY